MTGLRECSFLAAAGIIGLTVARAILLHKLPKVTFRVAWLVIILRLLVPFSVPVFDAPFGGGTGRPVDSLAGSFKAGTAGGNAGTSGGRWETGSISGGIAGENAGNLLGGIAGENAGNLLGGIAGENAGNLSDEIAGENAGNSPGGKDAGSIPGGMDGKAAGDDYRHAGNPQQNTGKPTNTDPSSNGFFPAIFYVIWLAGTVIVFLFFTVSHLRARRLYSTALPVGHPLPEIDFYRKGRPRCKTSEKYGTKFVKGIRRNVEVKVSDRIFAPVTYGIFSPVILLPKNTDWENTKQLRMVLLHEAVHIRRFDILYKWLLVSAVALHWFNPFVWVMYILANRDIELSCDEAVVRCLTGCGKKDYALALLSYEEKRIFSPTVSGFGGNAVRERMEAIMKTNKKSVIGVAMAVVLVAGTTTVFAGAKEQKTTMSGDGQQALSGTQAAAGQDEKIQNPDSQNLDGKDQKNQNPDAQGGNSQKPGHPEQNEKDGQGNVSPDIPFTVKQYICEPAYYTPEEFEEAMKDERAAIENELAEGSITQDGAEELLADFEKSYGEVKNGRQIEKPSPVYYADGTPVVGSDGCQLYAKASDIKRMNEDLREAAKWLGDDISIEEYDSVVELEFLRGGLSGQVPDGFGMPESDISWYTYEEYREYAEALKEEYRSMKGEWGFNLTDGWFEWDEERIAIACQLLDDNLEFIKNGGKISRPDKDGGVLMTGSSTFDFESADDGKWMVDGEKWVMSLEEAKENGFDVRTAEKAGAAEDGKLVRIVEITKKEFCGLSGLALK